jgi:hypothetical protein
VVLSNSTLVGTSMIHAVEQVVEFVKNSMLVDKLAEFVNIVYNGLRKVVYGITMQLNN